VRAAVAALVLAAAAPAAQAYCVHNQLKDRAVRVEQEPHPDKLRGERAFRHTLAPGERQCCSRRNLDCNPQGRRDSLVSLAVTLPGEPAYHCGYPEGAEPMVKVTGGGTIRIQHNPRKSSAAPYIVRVATHDKDITGPRGLACPPIPTKGKK
jgi:hypothetical protein